MLENLPLFDVFVLLLVSSVSWWRGHYSCHQKMCKNHEGDQVKIFPKVKSWEFRLCLFHETKIEGKTETFQLRKKITPIRDAKYLLSRTSSSHCRIFFFNWEKYLLACLKRSNGYILFCFFFGLGFCSRVSICCRIIYCYQYPFFWVFLLLA